MREVFIEVGTQVVFEALMLVVGIAFAYLTKLLGKSKKLEHIAVAVAELEKVVVAIVGDLQQTVVEKLKADSADGKLSRTDIEYLGKQLIEKAGQQISYPAAQTLAAAGVDIENMIHSIAEAEIARIKREAGFIIPGEAIVVE